ncbi:MAG: NAD(+)/NADH kinase [Clostridiales bacterium]|jgi:NAD+ kinase|nr:NAD(+)/NADH kinase [Clostridiales bacterium]
MLNFLVILNQKKHKTINFSQKIIEYLRSKKHNAFTLKNKYHIENIDFIITLGGDGLILSCSRKYDCYEKKIFAINFGQIGYLSSCQKNNVFISLDKLLENNFIILEKTRLKYKDYTALNEITISKSQAKLVDLSVFINNNFIKKYRADGLIISTPTGSTAYNLSAGGSVLDGNLKALIITPICDYNKNSYPYVIKDDSIIKITIDDSVSKVKIILDGQLTLEAEKIILIKASQLKTKIIKFN